MNNEIEAKIEYQKIIGEVNSGSYRPIRFSRIKYKASKETHIDIRQYQRGYDKEENENFFPTKIGFRFKESEFNRFLDEYALLPKTYLHPNILKKCFPLLKKDEFESAVLQAFKLIETRIRKKMGAKPEEIGVKLIRRAFHPESGMLTNYELPVAEREAFSNYIAGAFGFYKNPCSHRDIELTFISALDKILIASDLLKIIDKSKIKS